MKYIKLSFKYLFKNFLYIFLLAVIPAVFLGTLTSPFKIFEFMTNYKDITVNDFGSIFSGLFDVKFLPIFFGLIGLVILAIFVSLAIGQMENHMRSGKINYKSMFQYVNNNILVVLVNIFITLIIWFMLQFLLSAILFLLHLIISGLGNTPNVANIILAVLLCALKFVLFIQVVSIMLINIPNMLISGYPIKQAISNSIKLLNKNNFQFLLAMFLPFVIIIPLACLLKGGWCYLTDILGVLIIFLHYTTLCMTSYFELSGTPRYDNRKYYHYN